MHAQQHFQPFECATSGFQWDQRVGETGSLGLFRDGGNFLFGLSDRCFKRFRKGLWPHQVPGWDASVRPSPRFEHHVLVLFLSV